MDTATNAITTIPTATISRRQWRRLPRRLQRLGKAAAEQVLGLMAFHQHLHDTNTPHWLERREDGIYLLWGCNAENSAPMPGWSMTCVPVGTRILG
jgi:hypothetical protein